KIISINWPLWREGSMRPNALAQRAIETESGLAALEAEAGFEALEQAISAGLPQVMVLHGDVARLRERFIGPSVEGSRVGGRLNSRAVEWLKVHLGTVLKLSPRDMEARSRW